MKCHVSSIYLIWPYNVCILVQLHYRPDWCWRLLPDEKSVVDERGNSCVWRCDTTSFPSSPDCSWSTSAWSSAVVSTAVWLLSALLIALGHEVGVLAQVVQCQNHSMFILWSTSYNWFGTQVNLWASSWLPPITSTTHSVKRPLLHFKLRYSRSTSVAYWN